MGLDLVTIPLQIVQEALYAGVKPVITAPW
jgi:hypothetical protein